MSRELHFGAAARACHVSQPTVSTGIKALEQDLGQKLFHRTSRKGPHVQLTEFGCLVQPYLVRIVEAAEAVATVGRRMGNDESSENQTRQRPAGRDLVTGLSGSGWETGE